MMQDICAGCQEAVDATHEIGYVVRRYYCDECLNRATIFLEAEEALRKDFHAKFTMDRELLVAKFSEGGFCLPDVLYDP